MEKLNKVAEITLLFWLVIIATTTLGTEMSDFIDRSLHLGYPMGSLLLAALLALTLYLWHKKFKVFIQFLIGIKKYSFGLQYYFPIV